MTANEIMKNIKDNLDSVEQNLEQIQCDDCISRQAVQDYIAKYLSQYLYDDVREAVEVIDEYIGELPPVRPQEPKTGEPQETETWNGYHGQITAPKGTFEKIYEDAESEDEE